jgi:type IV secretion system protein TrbL
MTPDAGILTSIMHDFNNTFLGGVKNILPWAKYILSALITIDLTLALIFRNDDDSVLTLLLQKILLYGFIIYVVIDYRQLTKVIISGFSAIGLKAGGNRITEALTTDPSAISEYGIYVAKPIFDQIGSYHGMSAIYHFGDIFVGSIMGLLIMFSFGFMGIQFFLTWLEFYIVGCLSLIFIPFGVFKGTSFLSERAFGTIIAFGVKLMVLSFIASASIPLVKKWQLPAEPTIQMMFYALLGCGAIAFLSYEAPKLASSLLMGTPSLSAGEAIGSMMRGARTAGHAAAAAGHAVGGSMRAMGAVAQAAKMGAANGSGFRGAMAGVKNLTMANSPFGKGQIDAHRTMRAHARAMKSTEMKNRLYRNNPAVADLKK